jgi:CubicO group peptidase (beta-lactamase class C family)
MNGFDINRLERVRELLNKEVEADRLVGAAVQVSHRGQVLAPIVAGRRRLDDPSARVEADTIFLVASITKPIVAAGLMKLVEDGSVGLDDSVARYVPGFGENGKSEVLVRHLLTHTSGLPDQIPENRAYREAKRPMADFVKRICELPLLFSPGTKISYQSAGIAMLGEICERVSGSDLATYLAANIFDPLELEDTRLKMIERSDRESDVLIAGEGLTHGGAGTDFDWNSDYWRGFGAPWGGMLTTVSEMTRLLLAFRNGGELDGTRILSKGTVAAMVEDHSSNMPDLEEADRLRQRWGLGWRLGGPHTSPYGDLVSPDTYGHSGATGTLAWVDPESDVTCVIFTNDPDAAGMLRGRISNIVMGALVEQ